MADVLPFRGIRYNPAKIDDLSKVVTPPYDVISPEAQARYYDRHPANAIRLDFNMKSASDTPESNPYTRAGAFFREWLHAGILIRDEVPVLYFTSVDFRENGCDITRYGLMALVGLEPFEKGVVLPHERTFSKVKTERLELMKACHANFSPIFTLYPDPDNLHAVLKKFVENAKPDIDLVDDEHLHHRMWRIIDPELLRLTTEAMRPSRLFIADGHHRYETALNYRKWLAETTSIGPDHPANYIMMYLCSMKDSGLLIRAAHRLLPDAPRSLLDRFMSDAPAFFDIRRFPEAARTEFLNRLHSGLMEHTIGVVLHHQPGYFLFTLKPGVMERRYGGELDMATAELDVTVLTRLVLMDLLGFDQERLDNEALIAYSSATDEALDRVRKGIYTIGFVLNPTRIEQVRTIAESGRIMPRKATYFYPKALTGLVMNFLRI